MRGNPYLSRPVGSKEPPRPKFERRIVGKEVFIGNRPPTTRLHHAVAIDRFIPIEMLYDNRRRKR